MAKQLPNITFHFRVGDAPPASNPDGCPIGGEFVRKTTKDIFGGKRVLVFSLPGAYTPTCSTYQLPGFEENYNEIREMGIDEIYVSSVNDAFVMNAWADVLGIKNVKVLPDGNAEFANALGMLGDFHDVGFGRRSLRFAVILKDGKVEEIFIEPKATETDPDPYGVSSPQTVMAYLKSTSK